MSELEPLAVMKQIKRTFSIFNVFRFFHTSNFAFKELQCELAIANAKLNETKSFANQ